jgi:general secretion pathway protein B
VSYILDALRRADEARQLQEPRRSPGIPEPVAPVGPSRTHRVVPFILTAVVLAVAAWLGQAGHDLWSRDETQRSEGHQTPAAPSRAEPSATEIQRPPSEVIVATPPVSEMARPGEADRPPLPAPSTAPRARAAEAIAAVAIAPPVVKHTPADKTEHQRESGANEDTATANTSDTTPIVAWHDLPADRRRGLPRPRLDVHVHAENPQARFVMVDMRKYREGDALPDGSVLERIESDGVQLEYQGQRYRLPRR